MKFDKTEVTVSSSCKTVTINLAHTGKLPVASMGHNVVVATSAGIVLYEAIRQLTPAR